MDEPIVFPATKRYKIEYIFTWLAGLILSAFLGLLVLAQDLQQPPKVINIVIGSVPLLLIVVSLLYREPPRKLQIRLEVNKISGSIGNETIQLPFSEILHIEKLDYALRIDATNSQLLLEKRHFDLEQIQDELKKRLHSDVFVEKGWLNLPAYQELLAQENALYSDLLTKLPFRIKQDLPITYKIFAAIGTILFSAAMYFSWHQLGYGSLIFLFFAVLSVILLLRRGVVEVDSRQILYETRFRKFRILWENVTHVEYDDMLILAFQGQKQCLKIPSTLELRHGKEKDLFYFFLDQMVKQKNIEQRRSSWAFFRFNKNTRILK